MIQEIPAKDYVSYLIMRFPHFVRVTNVQQGYLKDTWEPVVWCAKNIGPGHGPKLKASGESIYVFEPNMLWSRMGTNFYFAEEKHACMFKLMFG